MNRFLNPSPSLVDKTGLQMNGTNILLRPVCLSDVTEEYVAWLNDSAVNQYLESRFQHHTLESTRDFVVSVLQKNDVLLLGIVRHDTGKHIGNIKLGPIDWRHRHGSIGLMIGDKASWGKGFGTEAIQRLTEYAFSVLQLHKVTAGAYACNLGSLKALSKAGFIEEARRKEHVWFDGDYIDLVLLGKIHESSR